MSRTPAAEAARLKLTYPLWAVRRHPDGPGWIARRSGYSFSAGAPSPGTLEIMIMSFEGALQTGRAIPPDGARAAGTRVP